MAQASRSAQFARLHKTLKKHYRPVSPDPKRPVLEHLIFACVLEDARYEPAEEAFAALVHGFFDWNEVRVTSISELAEVMAVLPDPRAAGNRVKRILQGVFEDAYSFDLEDRRKKNLGPTIKWLEKLDGSTPFVVNYVVQSALGGHAIPIDRGALEVLRLTDCISDAEAAARAVPGLERAISKAKGIEFGSLLHQLGADFTANPFSPVVREILLEVNPDAKQRLPKRRQPRPVEPAAQDATSTTAAPQAAAAAEPEKTGKRRKADAPTGGVSAPDADKTSTTEKPPGDKAATAETTAAKPPEATPSGRRKSAKPAARTTAAETGPPPSVPPSAKPPKRRGAAPRPSEPPETRRRRAAAADGAKSPAMPSAPDAITKRKPR